MQKEKLQSEKQMEDLDRCFSESSQQDEDEDEGPPAAGQAKYN